METNYVKLDKWFRRRCGLKQKNYGQTKDGWGKNKRNKTGEKKGKQTTPLAPCEKVSEYDQEMPQSHTTNQLMAAWGKEW